MNYFALTIIRSLLYTLCQCLHQLQLAERDVPPEQVNTSNEGQNLALEEDFTEGKLPTMEMIMATDNNPQETDSNITNSVNYREFDINTDVLARLADDVSIELMPELIHAFLLEVDTRLDTVKTTPLNNNENHIRTQVHSIKSCARTFGATELADKAAHIEQMIDADVSNIESQIQQMLALLPAIHRAFNGYLGELQQTLCSSYK